MIHSFRRCPLCNSPLGKEAYQRAIAQHDGIHRELKRQQRLTAKVQRDAEQEVRRVRDREERHKNRIRKLARDAQKFADENKRLKEQIERGETNQSQGLLEEKVLLRFLKDKFPDDDYDHTGKGGDIVQHVRTPRGQVVGRIVYEVKKVSAFQRAHIRQASEARRHREADYALLVTNAFPAKQKLFYVDGDVLVISPAGVEPLIHTARASLISIHNLKASAEQKHKAVQAVYDYLAGADYVGKITAIAMQKRDLEELFRVEVRTHARVWRRRAAIYTNVFNDVRTIDSRLRHLLSNVNGQELQGGPAHLRLSAGFVTPEEIAKRTIARRSTDFLDDA